MNNKTILIGAALATLVAVGGCAGSAKASVGQCHGINACRGMGDCGGKGHACAGKNKCKGHGWKKMKSSDCSAKGGTFVSKK